MNGSAVQAVGEVHGYFLDGASSILQEGTLSLEEGRLQLKLGAEGRLNYPLSSARLLDPIGDLPLTVEFSDGKRFETRSKEIQKIADQIGGVSVVHWLESKWRRVILCALGLVAVLVLFQKALIPRLSTSIAFLIPAKTVSTLSTDARIALEKKVGPSKLDQENVNRINRLQDQLQKLYPGIPMTLLPRQGRELGANALALPDGAIYVTDELIRMLGRDDEVLAVLLHEVGHVVLRHGMKSLIEGSLLSLLFASAVGSSEGLGFSVDILNSSYSRQNETEADDYAASELKKINLTPNLLGSALRQLDQGDRREVGIRLLVRDHPFTTERIERLARQSG